MAGITTSIVFPDADCVFDVGQGLPYQVPIPNVLITHGHMDHAAGLPYLISQKAMMGHTPPNIFMPDVLVRPMREIMRIWSELDGHTYQFQMRAAKQGESYDLKNPYFFKVFPTQHRVASQGYTVFERKKHLKPEFKTTPVHELGVLRKKGMILDDFTEEPILSFTGDTKIEFLDNSEVRKSRVLIMEITYWDEKKSVENARLWGHIHLDELIPKLDDIKSEKILLIHASARYTTPYLKEVLEARIPEQHKHRIEIFPRPI